MNDRAMKTYWLAKLGADAQGPYTFEQIETRWKSGDATADMLVMPVDGSTWTPLSRAMGAVSESRQAQNSVTVYRGLAFLLGWVGFHDFYAGETTYGYCKMLLFVVVVFTGLVPGMEGVSGIAILMLVVWILIDMIRGPRAG